MPSLRFPLLPKPEYIEYRPTRQESGDLEAGTKTITATSKPATPDYSWTETLPAPTDTRITVHRSAYRRQMTIDSNTGTLNVEIYRNGTLIEGTTFGSTGTKTNVIMSDEDDAWLGTSTFEVYLWMSAAATEAVISQMQFWLGVGVAGNVSWQKVLTIAIEGWCYIGTDAIGSPTASNEYHHFTTEPDTWEPPAPTTNYAYWITPDQMTQSMEHLHYIRKKTYGTIMFMRNVDALGIGTMWRLNILLWKH